MSSDLTKTQKNAILDNAKDIRAHLKRAIEIGPEDINAIAVEPMLEALGWSTRDPRQLRRPGGGVLTLLSRGRPALRLRSLAAHEPLPGSLGAPDLDDSNWIILTNGLEWVIFNRQNPARPFRALSLVTAAEAENSLEVLALLNHKNFKPEALSEAWMSEAMDADVTRALMRHLDGSDTLITTLSKDLSAQGLKISPQEIRAALSRIDVQLPNVTDESAETEPGTAESTPAPSTAAKPKKKTSPPAADAPWPKGATHAMQRRQTRAFVTYDHKTGKAKLLPGSVLTTDKGKTLTRRLDALREKTLADGVLEQHGDMLLVTKTILFDTIRNAASFAAGSHVKELSVWKTAQGQTLADQVSKGGPSKSPTSSKPKSTKSSAPAKATESKNEPEQAQPAEKTN